MTELKNCPFCGGEAEIKEHWGTFEIWGKHHQGCLFRARPASGFPTQEGAITAWNTRSTPDELASAKATIDRLAGALDDAAATLLAVRATAGGEDWVGSGDHFSKLCLETIRRINAAKDGQ